MVSATLVNAQDKIDQFSSTKQPPKTMQQGTESVPIFVQIINPKKSDKEAAEETAGQTEHAINERETVITNRRLLYATWVLGGIALLQLFVYGYQAGQMRQTVRASGEQSEAMERSIREATRLAAAMEDTAQSMATSSEAAKESVQTLKERTAAQMRAYLTTPQSGAIYQERPRLKFQGKISIFNAGHTPANHVSHRSMAAILNHPIVGKFDFPIPNTEFPLPPIGPQQSITISPLVDDYVHDDSVSDIKTGKGKCLYTWGIISYEDIFKVRHETRYCQHYIWSKRGPCPQNNMVADEIIDVYFALEHNSVT